MGLAIGLLPAIPGASRGIPVFRCANLPYAQFERARAVPELLGSMGHRRKKRKNVPSGTPCSLPQKFVLFSPIGHVAENFSACVRTRGVTFAVKVCLLRRSEGDC